MKVFFQFFGQRKGIEQMFDEEEPKKEKPINLDDLSVEEIEKMIREHQREIEMLSLLLEKKKEKLKLAENFFKIGLWQSCMDCAYSCLQFIREQRTGIQTTRLSAEDIESMWLPDNNSTQQKIKKVDLYNDHEQQMFMLLARCCLQNREYAQTWTWLRKCTLQTDKLQARALVMQAQLPRFLDHSLDYLRQAESIYRSYNDEIGVANTQYIRAQIFLEQGAYVQSQLLFQSIIEKISSNRNLWSLAFIGLIHSKYRRGADVLKSVNSFIDEARKSGNIFSLSNASYFGAISYMRSRNWHESERIFYVALALASTGGLVRVQAEVFSGLATCKALQGNIQQARQCHQQSYILLKSHNLEEETEVAKLRWLCTFLLDKPFDVFRQHMDRFQPSQTRLVQLWWSLCKMLRHSMITDKQGTDHWWQKAKKNGLFQMWDMNVCFLLQAIVKSSKPHSPDISKQILQEVQRIYRQNVQ